MSNLYITELSPESQSCTPQVVEAKNNEDTKKEIQNEFLNFLIEKETKYADIEKIESYYLTQTYEKKKKFNQNQLLIQKKHQEYKDLLLTIAEILIGQYSVLNTSFIEYYQLAIKKLEHQIKVKEHEKEVYSNTYNRLYHNNFMIKKRIDLELSYETVSDRQFIQYKILKNQAERNYNKQQKLLNSMKNYSEKSKMKFQDDRNQKAKKINRLEYEVQLIKKDSESLEKKLQNYKKKIDNVNKKLAICQQNIKNEKKEYLMIAKEYHQLNMNLIKIFKTLKVKKLEDVIINFNNIRDEYQNLKSSFYYYNTEIANLTGVLSKMDNELQNVNLKIEIKIKNEKNEIYENQTTRQKIGKIKETIFNFKQMQSTYEKKICLLQTSINFIYSQIQYLWKNYPSLQSMVIKDVTIYISKQKEINIPYIIDTNFVKTLCMIFIQFTHFLFRLLLKSMANGISEVSSGNHQTGTFPLYSRKSVVIFAKEVQRAFEEIETKKNIMRKNEKEIMSSLIKKKSFRIIQSNQISPNQFVSQSQMYEKFMNFMEENSKNLNKPGYLLSHGSKSSIDTGGQNSTFYETRQKFIKNNTRKIQKLFGKFENELVYRDKNLQDKHTFYQPHKVKLQNSGSTGSLLLHSNIKRKKALLTPTTKTFTLPYMDDNMEIDLEDYLNISEENQTNKQDNSTEDESKKSKIQYSFFGSDKELNTIYTRKNDIRKLELTYFKGIEKKTIPTRTKNENSIKNQEFLELYYEFMKKYGHKYQRKQKKSKTLKKEKRHANTVYAKLPPASIEKKEPEKTNKITLNKRISCMNTFNIKNVLCNQITREKMYKSKSEVNIENLKKNRNNTYKSNLKIINHPKGRNAYNISIQQDESKSLTNILNGCSNRNYYSVQPQHIPKTTKNCGVNLPRF